MHGFKPNPNADAQYADGGAIQPKRKLGFYPRHHPDETPEMANRLGGDGQMSASPARRKPTRDPNNAMAEDRTLQAEEQRQGFKAGGRIGGKKEMPPVDDGEVDIVQGPGTGTSDDVPAEMEKGTHILPAKTTEDVLLSNGEAAVSPEVVTAVGQAALDALRASTDGAGMGAPAAAGPGAAPAGMPIDAAPRGFNARELDDETPRFAVGGTVGEEEERRRNAAVGQIPTASGATATPVGQPVEGTETTRNLNNAANAVGGMSAGALARGFAAGSRALGNGVAAAAPALVTSPARTALAGAGAAAAGMATGDTNTQQDGAQPAQQPLAPAPGIAPAPVSPAAEAAVGRTTITSTDMPAGFAVPNLTIPGGTPAAAAPRNNIIRQGNSYSAEGGGPITEGATINGQASDRFSVVPGAPASIAAPAQAPAGFQPQGARLPPGQDYQSRLDLRNASVGLNSFKPEDRARARQQLAIVQAQQQQAGREQNALDVANIQGSTQQAVAGTRGAVDMATAAMRNQVDQGRLANETAESSRRTQAADLTAAQAQQLAGAQRAVLEAPTPEARKAAVDNLRALQGQYERPNRLVVVPGAKNADGSQDASQVYDASTGMPVQQQQATSRAAPPAGTVQNGYRFKGGNPADQKNWEKV